MSDNKILNLCMFLLCAPFDDKGSVVLRRLPLSFIWFYLGGRADLNFENLSYMGNRKNMF